jgi:hypothetical protein
MIYAVLTGWSAHHWTIDLYVLGENRSVLFTFEGI